MPTVRDNRSIPAATTVQNILDGSVYETIRRGGPITIAAVCDDATDVLMTVFIDTELMLEESTVPLEPGAGRGPSLQDDILLFEAVGRGDKITVRLQNTDAALARQVRTIISVP